MYGVYNYLYISKDVDGVWLSFFSLYFGNICVEYNICILCYVIVVNLFGNIMGKKKFDVLDELEIDGKKVEVYY